mmetsp:Transcript_102808/g.209542  ORF Transcript_102808/g.209542 Transcript_102808/m.209542 type:complete len:414 (-) Transcript_102808:3603-4844(-)
MTLASSSSPGPHSLVLLSLSLSLLLPYPLDTISAKAKGSPVAPSFTPVVWDSPTLPAGPRGGRNRGASTPRGIPVASCRTSRAGRTGRPLGFSRTPPPLARFRRRPGGPPAADPTRQADRTQGGQSPGVGLQCRTSVGSKGMLVAHRRPERSKDPPAKVPGPARAPLSVLPIEGTDRFQVPVPYFFRQSVADEIGLFLLAAGTEVLRGHRGGSRDEVFRHQVVEGEELVDPPRAESPVCRWKEVGVEIHCHRRGDLRKDHRCCRCPAVAVVVSVERDQGNVHQLAGVGNRCFFVVEGAARVQEPIGVCRVDTCVQTFERAGRKPKGGKQQRHVVRGRVCARVCNPPSLVVVCVCVCVWVWVREKNRFVKGCYFVMFGTFRAVVPFVAERHKPPCEQSIEGLALFPLRLLWYYY